jgi:hypothetical protein
MSKRHLRLSAAKNKKTKKKGAGEATWLNMHPSPVNSSSYSSRAFLPPLEPMSAW